MRVDMTSHVHVQYTNSQKFWFRNRVRKGRKQCDDIFLFEFKKQPPYLIIDLEDFFALRSLHYNYKVVPR